VLAVTAVAATAAKMANYKFRARFNQNAITGAFVGLQWWNGMKGAIYSKCKLNS